jgi:hypothetical protein
MLRVNSLSQVSGSNLRQPENLRQMRQTTKYWVGFLTQNESSLNLSQVSSYYREPET